MSVLEDLERRLGIKPLEFGTNLVLDKKETEKSPSINNKEIKYTSPVMESLRFETENSINFDLQQVTNHYNIDKSSASSIYLRLLHSFKEQANDQAVQYYLKCLISDFCEMRINKQQLQDRINCLSNYLTTRRKEFLCIH